MQNSVQIMKSCSQRSRNKTALKRCTIYTAPKVSLIERLPLEVYYYSSPIINIILLFRLIICSHVYTICALRQRQQ